MRWTIAGVDSACDDDAATAAAASGHQDIHLLDTSCNPPTRATASKQHSCSWSKDGDKAARWLSAHDATANRTVGCDLSAALPACAGRATPLGAFSAVCFHFAAALSEQLRRTGRTPPPIGLINVAVGSSAANEWMPPGAGAKCRHSGSSGKTRGGELWRSNAHPHSATALKGVLWYQGEHDRNKNSRRQRAARRRLRLRRGCSRWRVMGHHARIGAEVGRRRPRRRCCSESSLASGAAAAHGGSNYGWELGGLRDPQTAIWRAAVAVDATFVAQTYDWPRRSRVWSVRGEGADTADFSPSQCNASHELARESPGWGSRRPPAASSPGAPRRARGRRTAARRRSTGSTR